MAPEKREKDWLEAQIVEYIASRPQSLSSLIDLTKSTSAKVSWMCQNLRSKRIIVLNDEGLFCSLEPVSTASSASNHLQEIRAEQSLENSQQFT